MMEIQYWIRNIDELLISWSRENRLTENPYLSEYSAFANGSNPQTPCYAGCFLPQSVQKYKN